MPEVDASFLALPRHELASAALQRAKDLGARFAEFRLERIRSESISLRDGVLESAGDDEDLGLAVRVIHDGTWGFAAGVALSTDEAVRIAEQAVHLAQVSRPINSEPIQLADEPVYDDVSWVSAYEIDPLSLPRAEKVALLTDYSNRLLEAEGVSHVTAHVASVNECKFYANSEGTSTTQQRVRIGPDIQAIAVDAETGRFDSMASCVPPAGRGWEYMTGTGWNWDEELAQIPGWLAEKMAAPSVEAGAYDLVIDPTNLWLTIHESIGHATELDRALGYEANYAGTSFATLDKLNTLKYGSPVMHVTGDRIAEHGLSTVGYDDEGVAGQQWDLVKDGILVGYQVDRRMAKVNEGVLGTSRSNGCAYADSAGHIPIQRMANVSLQPVPDGPSTEELIAKVKNGIYIVGDKSWSIDMQRYNFQFTGQRFYKITDGKLDGQLRDVAYQATTTDFWGSMEAVGGPQTYILGGALNCGKAQPAQSGAVTHGCPSALFRGVRILNTTQEAGR
ncbi:TldD protein [Kribbella orskensis]|uniref:TldD protein n=1 Tax=Kribbella orskensis TaxID=2512216 RepID=A0ABY2BST4_9ACTN|nr:MULTISPECIES: TldD/PmbA family protein [Kribbella]TCN43355.1 TldD protein [Kribbella sp. VKM Ac-2500]TCO29289.1 TldD protein [Kribbella orskensis]